MLLFHVIGYSYYRLMIFEKSLLGWKCLNESHSHLCISVVCSNVSMSPFWFVIILIIIAIIHPRFMGTSVQVTPLCGVYNENPLSYLVSIDAFNILIDCGWNDHFDPSLLQPLSRLVVALFLLFNHNFAIDSRKTIKYFNFFMWGVALYFCSLTCFLIYPSFSLTWCHFL